MTQGAVADVERIPPPDGYANTGREGASAPDAPERRVPQPAPAPAPPLPRRAADICAEAARLVGGDRAVTHGDKTLNFANTAALWNAILEAKLRQTVPSVQPQVFPHLDALDVANMLEAFKIARRYSGSHNLDDYIDGAGYAGCAGEIAEHGQSKT